MGARPISTRSSLAPNQVKCYESCGTRLHPRCRGDSRVGVQNVQLTVTSPDADLGGEWECVGNERTQCDGPWVDTPAEKTTLKMTLIQKQVFDGKQTTSTIATGEYSGTWHGAIKVVKRSGLDISFEWANSKLNMGGAGQWTMSQDEQSMDGAYKVGKSENGALDGISYSWNCTR